MSNLIDFLIQARLDTFLLQAVATLIGAFTAFRLEASRRYAEMRRTNLNCLKKSLFTLATHRSFLLNLTAQQLNPMRENPIRALHLLPFTATPPALSLDVPNLTFLIEFDKGELLSRLVDVEMKFQSVVRLIEQRNPIHLRLQERLEAVANRDDAIEAAANFVAPAIAAQLKQLTDGLYEQTDRALARNREVHAETDKALREMFPGERSFNVEEREPAAN